MSWQMQAWAKKTGKSHKLESSVRYVLRELADHCHNDKGVDIYPSLSTLADDTGYTVKTIQRAIAHLLAIGLIAYGDQEAAAGIRPDRRPKVYKLVLDLTERKLDLNGVGHMPKPKRRMPWQRKPKPAPVDKSPEQTPPRPDMESGTTGHTGRHSVQQSFKSLKENPAQPSADAVPASPEVDAFEAGIRYREQVRARRLAKQGHPQPAASSPGAEPALAFWSQAPVESARELVSAL